eukprot:CAMPEP_0183343646 /NCGR_PEP_ID=MMETSP0164_2-20130417/9514_1 /TAXON_ID=221442 /ORGANISM="Coccolithus pelagicus ssp braarudi, Strain PLY182g" /LENGTH=71 /DNA_ID=CAMNT_0025514511 /DNA_START=153 /DNA_END=368 /DNA_ORIENTATION=-
MPLIVFCLPAQRSLDAPPEKLSGLVTHSGRGGSDELPLLGVAEPLLGGDSLGDETDRVGQVEPRKDVVDPL